MSVGDLLVELGDAIERVPGSTSAIVSLAKHAKLSNEDKEVTGGH